MCKYSETKIRNLLKILRVSRLETWLTVYRALDMIDHYISTRLFSSRLNNLSLSSRKVFFMCVLQNSFWMILWEGRSSM